MIIKLVQKHLRWLFVFFGICWLCPCTGQVTDLARVEYAYFPQSNSDNSASRFRIFANFPIRTGWEGSYLIPGIEYRNVHLDINDAVPFATDNLDNFQSFRFSLAYTFKLKNNWRIAAKGGFEIASNFEERTVVQRDKRLSGEIYAIKSRTGEEFEKPNRLVIGLEYTTNAGRPFPIPIINYYREFHPKWSYSVGSPKTNLKHRLSNKQSLQAYVSIDGFFSNLQSDLVVNPANPNVVADNVSMTLVMGGLGYEYNFTDHLQFYAYGAYTVFNEIRLRDISRNNVYTINDNNTSYLRTGIKLKI